MIGGFCFRRCDWLPSFKSIPHRTRPYQRFRYYHVITNVSLYVSLKTQKRIRVVYRNTVNTIFHILLTAQKLHKMKYCILIFYFASVVVVRLLS